MTQAVTGTHPQPAVTVHAERSDVLAGWPVGTGKRGKLAVAPTVQTRTGRAEPQIAFGIVRNSRDLVRGEAAGLIKPAPLVFVPIRQASVGAHPDAPAAILMQR